MKKIIFMVLSLIGLFLVLKFVYNLAILLFAQPYWYVFILGQSLGFMLGIMVYLMYKKLKQRSK